ncbi:formimidoylglutamate deiminase [Permianibacter sp. IMCC34836]|uniref:formimidoylglutamate deiminase n=1 Tax=Permianibacter fluminis TaxID=2738515 RepID=UPI00155431F3|nr:formimidoylglutamate deiminase [Permianibacter fluminis]NQD38799.1 formimidoylglutamate deiminase [Permianibacter fluminis]
MKTLFAERALLAGGWARDVQVAIADDGRIARVETGVTAAADAERLHGPLLPGLTNLHSHAFQRAMAGLTEYRANPADSFWTWRDLMYRFAAMLQPEHLQAVAAQLYVEMLKAGYTGVCEFHYLHHDVDGKPYADPAEMSWQIVAAAEQTGIALTHLPVLYRYGGFGPQPAKDGQKRFLHDSDAYAALLQRLHKKLTDPRHRLGIAPHSLRAVTPELLTEALTAIHALDQQAPVHIHIAEQTLEVDDCLRHTGQRPVAYLFDQLPVDAHWCLVHATHLDDRELQLLAQSGAVAGICTTTEANLGDGFFRMHEYLAAGGVFGVGSDSHISVSAVEELRWLEYGQRLLKRERAVLGNAEVSVGRRLYDGALRGGARAAGRQAGAIATGQIADLIVLQADVRDERRAAMGTGDAVLDSWLFASNDNRVRDVMVQGRWCIRDGHHAAEERIASAYQQTMRQLLA